MQTANQGLCRKIAKKVCKIALIHKPDCKTGRLSASGGIFPAAKQLGSCCKAAGAYLSLPCFRMQVRRTCSITDLCDHVSGLYAGGNLINLPRSALAFKTASGVGSSKSCGGNCGLKTSTRGKSVSRVFAPGVWAQDPPGGFHALNRASCRKTHTQRKQCTKKGKLKCGSPRSSPEACGME